MTIKKMTIRLVYDIIKYDKNRERFATISNSVKFSHTVPNGLLSAVLINLSGRSVLFNTWGGIHEHGSVKIRSNLSKNDQLLIRFLDQQ